MGQEDSSTKSDQGLFDKTRWSVVLQAVQSCAPGGPQALAQLCERYWRPLYAFARRRGRYPEDAQDLVQGFFEYLIASRGLSGGGPVQRKVSLLSVGLLPELHGNRNPPGECAKTRRAR